MPELVVSKQTDASDPPAATHVPLVNIATTNIANMVYCGKPSKGCAECRNRKVRVGDSTERERIAAADIEAV